MWKCILVVFLCLSFVPPSYAQVPPAGQTEGSTISGPRKQLATIVFAGLAGAILGLSTLSFYGRPQDYLSNIAIGFAIGVIVGTSYTTYKAATKPYEFYNYQYDLYDRPSFEGIDQDFDWKFLSGYLREGEIIEFSDSTASEDILISQQTADRLKLELIFSWFTNRY